MGKDRTQEFLSAVDSMLSRASAGPLYQPPERSSLLSNADGGGSPAGPNGVGLPSKSDFARLAGQVAKEINTTVTKLQKLSRLARKKSLFDDRPLEINELIHIIKQDISKINRQISQLSAHVAQGKRSGSLGNRQVEEHAANVVTSLQTRLASASGEFKSVLEVRTQNMKEQKSRKEEYSFAPSTMSTQPPTAAVPGSSFAGQSAPQSSSEASALFRPPPRPSDSPLYNPDRKLAYNPAAPNDSTSLSLGGASSMQNQQQQLVLAPQQSANLEYLDSRAAAIDSIESTIAELGQIYSQFAQILSQQREMVQRIDDNVVDVEMNVVGAHDQLLRYFQNMGDNRWLMIRVFAIVVVFFLLFVLIT